MQLEGVDSCVARFGQKMPRKGRRVEYERHLGVSHGERPHCPGSRFIEAAVRGRHSDRDRQFKAGTAKFIELLELLVEAGQARWTGTHYEPSEILAVDTRSEPGAARALAVFWAQQGASRLQQGADGHFAYNLFAVSNADYDRLRELQRAYFAQIRAIIAESAPAQCVALINLQMFPVAGGA